MEQVVDAPCPTCGDDEGFDCGPTSMTSRTSVNTPGHPPLLGVRLAANGPDSRRSANAHRVDLGADGARAPDRSRGPVHGLHGAGPELDLEVAPGASSTGYVSNVEGVLQRFVDVLDIVERDVVAHGNREEERRIGPLEAQARDGDGGTIR